MALSPEFRSTVVPRARSSFDGLLALPTDVWAEFTSYLEPTDVLKLFLASQETLKRLMNGGIVRFVTTVPISSYPQFLCQSTSIRHLSLMLPRRDMFLRQMRNRDGEIVVSLPKNVTSLHLQFFGAFDLLKKEISHLAHLRHLTIATERHSGLAEVMKVLPVGLESLRLIADNLTTPFIQLPRYLTRLTIKPPQWQEYKSGYLMDEALEQNILPSTLIEFKYKGWSNLTSACFVHLPRGMHRLHLQLDSLYGVSAHGTPLSPPNRPVGQSVLSDLPRTLVFLKLVLRYSPSNWPTDGLPDTLIHSRQYVSQDPHRPSGSDRHFFSVHSSTQEWNRLTSTRGYFDEHRPPTRMPPPLNGRSVEGGLTEGFGIIHHCIHTLPPSLTKLAIVELALSTKFSTILQVLSRQCSLLRFLQVAGTLITDPQIIGLFPRSLETLHIKSGLYLKKLDLSLLPPKLKALSIPGIVLSTDQEIESLPKSLTYLSLGHSSILRRSLLEQLLPHLPMIYTLTEPNECTHLQSVLESYRWSDPRSYHLRVLDRIVHKSTRATPSQAFLSPSFLSITTILRRQWRLNRLVLWIEVPLDYISG
jgi:hypothetical protein